MLVSLFYLQRDGRHQMTLGEMNPIPHLSTAQILLDAISGRQITTTLQEGQLRNRNWQRARKHQMEKWLIRKGDAQGSTSVLFHRKRARSSIKKSSFFLLTTALKKLKLNKFTLNKQVQEFRIFYFLKLNLETEKSKKWFCPKSLK